MAAKRRTTENGMDREPYTSIPTKKPKNGENREQPAFTTVQTTDALNRCEELILKVESALEREESGKCEDTVKHWKNELEDIKKLLEIHEVPVAVVGATGAGKSSLINAVVDQWCVLPTSGTQACTSVVVKIENNPRNEYEAEISFLEKEEWQRERDLLVKDMTKNDGTLKRNSKADEQTPAGVAFLKMRAVYGPFTSVADLEKETSITSHLGRKIVFRDDSLADFRPKVEKYIVSTEKEGEHFWPIIKMVTIRIPGFDTGCILVDLPGVGDANAARDGIAQEYLQKCSNIIVVAVVQRAISEKTAKNLLGDRFRQQLKMDGNYTSDAIKFVCTKNDDLTINELVRELKLEDKVKHLQEKNIALSKELKTLEGSQGYEKEKEIEKNCKEMRLICAKGRSEKAKRQLKIDFKKGIKDLKYPKSDDDEDDDDYDDDDDDNDYDDDDDHSTKNLEVFCVSSNDYWSLKKNDYIDVPKVFNCEDDTEIPALRKWIKNLGERNRHRAVEQLMFNLAFFLKSVKNFLQDNDQFRTDSDSLRSDIKTISTNLQTEFQYSTAKLHNDLIKEVYNIETNLRNGQIIAENEAINTCCSWDKYHTQTLKAVIRRMGKYKSRQGGDIDFNFELSCPLFKSVQDVWDNFFSKKVFGLIDSCRGRIQEDVNVSLDRVSDVVNTVIPEELLTRIIHLIKENTRIKLDEKMQNLKKLTENEQRKIHRSGFDFVQTHLTQTYNSCPLQGIGMKKLALDTLREGIDREKETMFSELKKELTKELKNLMQLIKDELLDVCDRLTSYLLVRFEPLWSVNGQQLRSTIFDDVDKANEAILKLCESYGINVDFDGDNGSVTQKKNVTSQRSHQDKSMMVFSPYDLQRAFKLSRADYDKQEYAEYRLKRLCGSHGMEFLGRTPENGNCFFEAVSSQLRRLHLNQSPRELRHNVIDYLKRNPTFTANNTHVDQRDFVGDFAKYCDQMSKDGEWSDHVIVVAMARMLQMNICIITSSPDTTEENCLVWVDGGKGSTDTKPLLLGHYWERHYQSLQPKASCLQ